MKQVLILLTVVTIISSCRDGGKLQSKESDIKKDQTTKKQLQEDETILAKDYVFKNDCPAIMLDWQGKYMGATPGKNGTCRLHLDLKFDWTYDLKINQLTMTDKGDYKEDEIANYKGAFTFNPEGTIIRLLNSHHPLTDETISVRLAENYLDVLDGKFIPMEKDGDLNTLYNEKKVNQR